VDILQAIVLGIVQGITEFLPVSSSGHLVLVPSLLGWPRFGLGFDVMLHVGTLFAIAIYFWKDIVRLAKALFSRGPGCAGDRRLAWLIIAATVPSMIIALALEPFVGGVEMRPVEQQIVISAWGLLGTAVLLGGSEVFVRLYSAKSGDAGADDAASKGGSPGKGLGAGDASDVGAESLSWEKALMVGLAQGVAALPGVSRAGSTIAAGQAVGMRRDEAGRFSFLLSIPIVLAATAKHCLDIIVGKDVLPSAGVIIAGVATTTAVGYLAIRLLLPFIKKHSLWWFVAYTAMVGVVLLLVYHGAF